MVGGRAVLLATLLPTLVSCRRDDAAGVAVAPFVDHHVHLFNVGWSLLQQESHSPRWVMVGGATSEGDAVSRVAAAVSGTAWVTGAGWNQEAWGVGALPGADSLSVAVPRAPVALARSDGHSLWVNRRALSLAGIESRVGVLLEREVEPVVALIAQPTDAEVIAAWRRGAEAMAERGVTRVYDAGVLAIPGVVALNADFARFVRLAVQADTVRPLMVEVNLMVPAPSAFAESVLVMPAAKRRLSPNIRVTHIKLFADGALGSRGAALSHSYADDESTEGVLRMQSEEIAAWTRRALDAGLDVATHAIGDRAVHEVLDAYEAVIIERPDIEPARLRIEHFSFASEEDLERAVKLGVALSVQSNFNTPRGTSPTFAEKRVGPADAERVYAWDRLERAGALLVEGSDYFGLPGEPLAGMHAALTGINAIGERGDTPEVRDRILRLHQAWLAPGGGLVPPARSGPRIRLSADPLRIPADSLLAVRVLPNPD